MDIILRNARIHSREGLWNIGIAKGRIAKISKGLRGTHDETLDLKGRLVMPSFIDMHVHLDAVFTSGYSELNTSGTLLEGIAVWGDTRRKLTSDLIRRKAGEALKWMVSNGTTRLRTHADTSEPDLRIVKALLDVREGFRHLMDIEVTAFPQDGILTADGCLPQLEKAVEMGADNVGLIPHNEYTREDGVRSVKIAFEIAEENDKKVDGHIDETDDPQSRFLEVVAAETIRRGFQGRVTAGHTTAMHSYDNAYAFKLFQLLKKAQLTIVPNPLTNIHVQGRFDTYPKRRGMTRVKELLESGINVALGHDCIMDPWYPLGMGDMMQPLFMAVHIGHMMGHQDLVTAFDLITHNSAKALGISDQYGVEEGKLADLVVLDARNEIEALAKQATRTYVFKGGVLVARNTEGVREVRTNGRFEELGGLPLEITSKGGEKEGKMGQI